MKVTNSPGSDGRQKGYSVFELLIVLVIAFIVLGISLIQLQPFWQQLQANSALQQIKETLRDDRELAISERRTIVVQFPTSTTISMYVINEPSNVVSSAPFLSMPLPGQSQFMTFSGETDTPDKFGIPSSGGIEFGGSSGTPTSGVEFQSDGTFTDGNGNPINGTIFIGVPKVTPSARAVTILGNTGRIKAYRYSGGGWAQ
jgi:Tfp pilus assembly protein FimT